MNIRNLSNTPITKIQLNNTQHSKRIDTRMKADEVSFSGSVTPSDKMSVYAIKLLDEAGLKAAFME